MAQEFQDLSETLSTFSTRLSEADQSLTVLQRDMTRITIEKNDVEIDRSRLQQLVERLQKSAQAVKADAETYRAQVEDLKRELRVLRAQEREKSIELDKANWEIKGNADRSQEIEEMARINRHLREILRRIPYETVAKAEAAVPRDANHYSETLYPLEFAMEDDSRPSPQTAAKSVPLPPSPESHGMAVDGRVSPFKLGDPPKRPQPIVPPPPDPSPPPPGKSGAKPQTQDR